MMKKILFILFLLSTHSAFAQLPPPGMSVPEAEQQGIENHLFFGFWDEIPDSVLQYVNTVKVHIDNVESAPVGKKIIPFIGNFHPDDSETVWRKRLRNKGRALQDINPERIPFVILTDEPYPDGFDREKLEKLVELARQEIGTQYRYTYSFTRTTIETPEREIPRNLDLVGINFYPFYHRHIGWQPYHTTEQEFYDFFDEIMTLAREQSPPGTEFLITGQAFSQTENEKWRKPPAEAPLWYREFISQNPDIIALLWFEYDGDGNKWKGTKDLPEILLNVKEFYEELPEYE